jgi:hypothetical protein
MKRNNPTAGRVKGIARSVPALTYTSSYCDRWIFCAIDGIFKDPLHNLRAANLDTAAAQRLKNVQISQFVYISCSGILSRLFAAQ